MAPTDTTSWETHPVTPDRFDDFVQIINPNRRAKGNDRCDYAHCEPKAGRRDAASNAHQ